LATNVRTAVGIRIERWVDLDEIDAAVRQFVQLVEIIPAVDGAGVDVCDLPGCLMTGP
jgi:acetoacetate decarboxylase